MDREALIARLQGIKALADRGDAGERQLAQQKLEELLKKYKLSEDDISDDTQEYFDIRYYQPWEQLLLWQIGYMVLNSTESYGRKAAGRNRMLKVVVFKCTRAQFLEIEYLFSFYRELFQRELNMLLSAFIQKHALFGDPDVASNGKKFTDEELSKMFAMMGTLEDSTPRTAIEMQN